MQRMLFLPVNYAQASRALYELKKKMYSSSANPSMSAKVENMILLLAAVAESSSCSMDKQTALQHHKKAHWIKHGNDIRERR